ncbi:hypothetical protein Bca4012_024242 [Brassica carinata]
MQSRMDTQQIRLDSLEDLLGVMAVGNRLCRELWMLGELLSGCNNLLPSPLVETLAIRPPLTTTSEPFHSFFFILFPFVLYYEFKYL